MKSIILLIAVLSFGALAKNNVKEKSFYGEKIVGKNITTLDAVVKDYTKFENKDVVMEANVEKVCVQKGCWMTLQGSDRTFRVKFHDYSFFVPMSLIGKKVLVQGKVLKNELSIADTKHYLKDAGASKETIAAVDKPRVEYSIIAKGVRVLQ